MLKGYRTYILGGIAILGAAASYLVGDASLNEAINLAVTAGMAMFVRSGVTYEVTKAVSK
ncbi:hypothetical protein UFOVP149_21 [uncultured Caudovirales phage]|uniref:Uncharacterized protein n=1 Tax=uncultured Caudovirales phage TaxID=2100421 RepID=A0A6J7W7V6_9CAUD|nr:hypothetical protein UFOVP149_21 [uncultured Caudovirales phage]